MRIVVAMSGGVDSSVVAGLLAEAGHEVIGVTLQLYDHGAAVGRNRHDGAHQSLRRAPNPRGGRPGGVPQALKGRDVFVDAEQPSLGGAVDLPCCRASSGLITDRLVLGAKKGCGRGGLRTRNARSENERPKWSQAARHPSASLLHDGLQLLELRPECRIHELVCFFATLLEESIRCLEPVN